MDRKVIIGYDGSPNAADALALGRQLCEALSATPLVASTVGYPDYLMDASDLRAAVKQQTDPHFAAAREQLAGMEVETWATNSDSVAGALSELAEAKEPLAIVIGSAHRGPVGRVLLGSTGKSLLPAAPCAVAVAPRGYRDDANASLRSVGVAVNGTAESRAALGAAVGLAQRLNGSLSSLTLLSVAGLPAYSYIAAPGTAAVDIERAEEVHATTVLQEAAAEVPESLSVSTKQLKGDAALKIAEASGDLDLLVIGSRGYGPVRRVLLGSVSAGLLRTAPCPLLVIPRAAGPDPLRLADAKVT